MHGFETWALLPITPVSENRNKQYGGTGYRTVLPQYPGRVRDTAVSAPPRASRAMAHQYTDHTDSIEEKIQMLADARASGDTTLALSLAESIKESLRLESQLSSVSQCEGPGCTLLEHPSTCSVEFLPGPWRAWAAGWRYFTAVQCSEPTGRLARENEPVELVLTDLPAAKLRSPRRELRCVQIIASAGSVLPSPKEIPVQVVEHSLQGDTRTVRLLFFASVDAGETATFLVLFGNPSANVPQYATDLVASGEGLGLMVSNAHYSAELNNRTGQLRTLRYNSGTTLTAVGQGHGEEPGFDWGNGGDYLDSAPPRTPGWQKFRTTNWHMVPTSRRNIGPLAVRVRRCGFPTCAVPPLYSQARMHVDTEYTFFAGQTYFTKRNKISFIKDMTLNYMRDDEWVFSGNNCWAVDHSVSLNDSYDPIFSHLLWMEKGEPDNSDGACAPTVNTAAAAQQRCNDCNYGRERRNESHTSAGVGFFSETTAEAFTALFLRRSATDSHDSTGSRERRPLSSHVRTDQFLRAAPVSGSTLAGGFTRVPEGGDFKAGEMLTQDSAYSIAQYREDDDGESARRLLDTRDRLLQPLQLTSIDGDSAVMAWRQAERAAVTTTSVYSLKGQLSHPRRYEDLGRTAALKEACWAAAATVHDGQFKHGPNIVSLGFVDDLLLHDVEMSGVGEECGTAAATVEVVLVMPTQGRPMYMTIGVEVEKALLTLPGVRAVHIRCTWDDAAAWSVPSLDEQAYEVIFGERTCAHL